MSTLPNGIVDAPVDLGAGYVFDANDRRLIDDEILACEQALIDCVIGGMSCTWFTLDPGATAPAVGQAVVSLNSNLQTVALADTAGMTNAVSGCGICLRSTAPGGKILVAIGGVVPASITGLGAGLSGPGYIDPSTARMTRTETPYPMGQVAADGALLSMAPLAAAGSPSELVFSTQQAA